MCTASVYYALQHCHCYHHTSYIYHHCHLPLALYHHFAARCKLHCAPLYHGLAQLLAIGEATSCLLHAVGLVGIQIHLTKYQLVQPLSWWAPQHRVQQHLLNHPVGTFRLAVSLGVMSSAVKQAGTQPRKQLLPEP